MTAPQVLALDLGSSSVKAVIFDEAGEPVEEHSAAYPTREGPDGSAEQDPRHWWTATCEAVGRVARPERIGLLALAGTMQNLIALDATGEPLRPAMLYSDSRAHREFAALAPALEAADAARRLGNAPNPQMPLVKLAWLRRHEPQVFARIDRLLFGAKDYLALRLTGRCVLDPTCASTLGLVEFDTGEWAPDLVTGLAGVETAWLPEILPAGAIIGRLGPAAAGALGLPEGTGVVNGCGDVGAATLGVVGARPGATYIYLGTSGWVAHCVPRSVQKHSAAIYRLAHPQPDLAIDVSAFLTAGSGVDWLARALGQPASLAALEAAAADADADPPEAMFLPYLHGERGPFNDPLVRAAFWGLDPSAGPGALYYALLEGIAFAIRANREALGSREPALALVGGGGQSALWPQIIADVLGSEVQPAALPASATAAGACALALQALGRTLPEPGRGCPVQPRAERRERLARRWQQFQAATEAARALARGAGAAPQSGHDGAD